MYKKKLNSKDKKNIASTYSLILGLGINMIVIIFGCFFLGRYIDKLFSTEPIFMIIFLILGVLSAFRNLYVMSMGSIK